jgi:hypothetical protein
MPETKSESFAPSVRMSNGNIITPPGWVWILAFAIGGCEWAVREASKPEFRERIKSELKSAQKRTLESIKKKHQEEIDRMDKYLQDLAEGKPLDNIVFPTWNW